MVIPFCVISHGCEVFRISLRSIYILEMEDNIIMSGIGKVPVSGHGFLRLHSDII